MTAVTRPTRMYAASCVMEGTHVAALSKSVHADTPKAGDEAKTTIVANACAVRVMRNLTPITRHTAPIALKSLGKHSVALPLGELGNVGPKRGDETPQTRQK
jgi:hypothetical protein